MRNEHLAALLASALLASTWLVGACGGTKSPPNASSGDSLTPWNELESGQKLDRMKTVVVPRMKEVFQGHDAQEFAQFNCVTCHGSGAKGGSFHMPNAELPALNPADGFRLHRDEHPNATKFMMEEVVPEMAKALGESAYDPATQKGFGCFECHTKSE